MVLYLAGRIFILWLRNRSKKYYRNTTNNNRREGEVTVENNYKSDGKRINKDEGEYISFEDVEDK